MRYAWALVMTSCAADPATDPRGPAADATSVTDRAAGPTTFAATAEAGHFDWQPLTTSPQPSPRHDDIASRASAACDARDEALDAVARRLAHRQAAGLDQLDTPEMTFGLRAAGAPHVWPRAWTLASARLEWPDVDTRLTRWLTTFDEGGSRRCGAATSRSADGESEIVAVVAVDALADLRPLPTRARLGQWLEVDARLLVDTTASKVVVLGPRGVPRPVPTASRDDRVSARFSVDQPGEWLVQVLSDTSAGPRPVLEALVYVDREPPAEFQTIEAPGEKDGAGVRDARESIRRMVDAARRADGLTRLAPDPRLTEIANEHARSMMKAGRVAHDVGNGDPTARLRRAGLDLKIAGENVAHAKTIARAHRALWASPSHRSNVLHPRFDAIGIGVAVGPDSSVWVCEVFANFGGAGIGRSVATR